MRALIEPEAVLLGGSGSTSGGVSVECQHGRARPSRQGGGGQPGKAGADDHDVVVLLRFTVLRFAHAHSTFAVMPL
jgi:hypothetical protein